MNRGFLQDRALQLLNSLRDRFRELECRDFPSRTASHTLGHLAAVLTEVEGTLSSADENTLTLVIYLVIKFQSLLNYFDNAHAEQTPRGLVHVLEDLLKNHRLYQDECEFIAAPAADYNYTIIYQLSEYIQESCKFVPNLGVNDPAKECFQFFKKKLFIISFPRIERDNILTHAVFGHEVGHLVADSFLNLEANYISTEFNAVADEIRKSATKDGHTGTKFLEIVNSRLQLILKCLSRGLKELISDYVGMLLFGPSELFAFHSVVFHAPLDALPCRDQYYPPHRYRFRFGLQVMNEQGLVEAFRNPGNVSEFASQCFGAVSDWFDQLKVLTEDQSDLKAIENADVAYKAAFDLIEKILPKAKTFAQQKISAIVYSKELIVEEVAELVDRIALNVPPSEIGYGENLKQPTWASAILAGWCYSINGKTNGELPCRLTIKDRETVNKLVLRAVESLLLLQKYRAALGASG
jgi:hypothetical protein